MPKRDKSMWESAGIEDSPRAIYCAGCDSIFTPERNEKPCRELNYRECGNYLADLETSQQEFHEEFV